MHCGNCKLKVLYVKVVEVKNIELAEFVLALQWPDQVGSKIWLPRVMEREVKGKSKSHREEVIFQPFPRSKSCLAGHTLAHVQMAVIRHPQILL